MHNVAQRPGGRRRRPLAEPGPRSRSATPWRGYQAPAMRMSRERRGRRRARERRLQRQPAQHGGGHPRARRRVRAGPTGRRPRATCSSSGDETEAHHARPGPQGRQRTRSTSSGRSATHGEARRAEEARRLGMPAELRRVAPDRRGRARRPCRSSRSPATRGSSRPRAAWRLERLRRGRDAADRRARAMPDAQQPSQRPPRLRPRGSDALPPVPTRCRTSSRAFVSSTTSPSAAPSPRSWRS